MKKIIIVILVSMMIDAVTIGAVDPIPMQKMSTYAVIVSGINKDPKERQAKDNAITNLRNFLINNAQIEPNRLSILVGRPSPIHTDSKLSSAENLKKQIDKVTAAARPSDRFIFYYVGQANIVGNKLRLNLPGRDITHEQLAVWLKGIKTSSMLIVLDCPGAGLTVKALSENDRIIIGACTEEERYSTKFSKYFVPALTNLQSDTDNDGKVSVLEAFTLTARQLDDSYRRQNLLQTETPILEDNADGKASLQPWRYQEDYTDGLTASMCFLSKE